MTHPATPGPAAPGPAQPPPGWFPLGTHADRPDLLVVLSWTHLGDDGLPMWERPITTDTQEQP